MTRHAPLYDATRWAFLHGRKALVEHLDLPVGAKVLDVGCGTGVALDHLRRRDPTATLTGLDPSLAMLGRARRRLGPEVQLIHGRAPADLPAGPFDAALCCYALSMMEAVEPTLAAIRTRLAVGGRLGVVDFLEPRGALGRAWFRRFPVALDPDLPARIAASLGGDARTAVRASPWGLWRWFEVVARR